MSKSGEATNSTLDRLTAQHWDQAAFVAALEAAVVALGDHAASLDALNVFPVADRDTGTNLLLTARAAFRAARAAVGQGLPAVTRAAARGALQAAHGNSGVLLSQFFRAFAEVTVDRTLLDHATLAEALLLADRLARQAVLHPVEGTMLTVLRAAATAASRTATTARSLADALTAARDAALDAVERTPSLLPILHEHGVVDAGAWGLAIVLDAWTALARDESPRLQPLRPTRETGTAADAAATGFCVNALLHSDGREPETLARALAERGESIDIISDGTLLRVHLHTRYPDQVRELLRSLCHVQTFVVDPLTPLPHGSLLGGPIGAPLVVLSPAPGIVRYAQRLGALGLLTGSDALTPHALAAILRTLPADRLLLLTGCAADTDVASVTTRLLERPRLDLLPAPTLAAQLVTLSVFDPERALDEVTVDLCASLARVRCVDLADVRAPADAACPAQWPSEPHPALESVTEILEALTSLGPEDAELCTLVVGEAVVRVDPFRRAIARRWPHLQIELFWGHQQTPALSIALE
ncbi:MAG: DAK2 domain-containing protein [Thermomicrobium sp.]|nr:DAK2 domain-containing protein [Thermomicrobium sp.]